MLEQLQHAYEKSLQNLVFVDFMNKKVISSGGLRGLEIELSKEIACRKDLITAINYHFRNGDFDLGIELIDALSKRADYIKRLDAQVKAHRRNKLSEIASRFEKISVVSRNANPS
ncbi:hypothetical protein U1P98_18515 [Lysinibacillus irui]|uniref:Uncharacterized protein n=1 Tax=Lysinibacillus irui TaxID=2998077 RepID=A0ABU5NQI2_9BACI|nr:hypothetical protein [Lysinibacillus irui]MEA0556049.1 hypothetical protein [Lysinibacillus irui]MEA0978303.1 hypothetical protein [Lysinibacillus irui]MEA1044457.1 hypothetical protein [Lysinibacillus irui]